MREKREDLELAMETLFLMLEKEIQPNIMTYGALARCCKRPSSIRKFLKDLKNLEVKPNVVVMNTLITSMAVKLDVKTVHFLLRYCAIEQVKVNKQLIHSVERFYQTYKKMIILKEKGEFAPKSVDYEFKRGLKSWEAFVDYYPIWLSEVGADLTNSALDQYKTIKDAKDEEWRRKNKS